MSDHSVSAGEGDLIERAEAAQNKCLDPDTKLLLARLAAALKAARAENERLRAVIEPLRNFMPRFDEVLDD